MQVSKTESSRNRNISVVITLSVSGLIILALVIFKIGTSVFKTEQSPTAMVLETGEYNTGIEGNSSQKQIPVSIDKQEMQSNLSQEYVKGNDIPVAQSDANNIIKQYKTPSNHQNVSASTDTDKSEFVPGTTPVGTGGTIKTTGLPFGEGFEFNLANRKVILSPQKANDTKEEGKVVVEIMVDKSGSVVEGNPNGRGTTTASSILKAKAKQIALTTKFNEVEKPDLQKGTISIIFSFD